MQRKIQIEDRIFPVGKQRIPDLVASSEKRIRLRRLLFQFLVGGVSFCEIKVLGRKAVKRLFARQHT